MAKPHGNGDGASSNGPREPRVIKLKSTSPLHKATATRAKRMIESKMAANTALHQAHSTGLAHHHEEARRAVARAGAEERMFDRYRNSKPA